MDNILYDSLSSYYHALELHGYMSHSHAQKLLLLIFYRDFTLRDYRGLLSKEDYHLIERALDCLWGSSCLIPYPDYLKMGKLHLGEVTEMAHRLKVLEDEPVLKVIHSMDGQDDPDSDIMIMGEDYEETPTPTPPPTPTPTPTEHVVKTIQWTHVTSSDNAGIEDEDTFYIDVDDIINTYNTYGNCFLKAGNNVAARLWCCYYPDYDPNDGDMENIEKIEDSTAMDGMEEIGNCLYITLPYSLDAYSISYLEHLKAASTENLDTLLILVDDGKEGPMTNGKLKIVYTE